MKKIVTDDGVHWEHLVISSADAERTADGELRVRLLRPLRRVRALRLVYAELPKTTRTLDLMLDIGTQAGRLVTQQVARNVKSNENDTQQRQAFGRIFVEDSGSDDFFEAAASLAFTRGTVPRFLYQNDNGNYMRFEFRPVMGSMQLLNVKLYSALLDENGRPSIYSPDLHIVSTGTELVERNSVLLTSDAAAATTPLVMQPSGTVIRKSTDEEYGYFLETLSPLLSTNDFVNIEPSDLTGVEGFRTLSGYYPGTPKYLEPIAIDVFQKAASAPAVQLYVQDARPPTVDVYGIMQSTLQYSLTDLPAALKSYLFESSASFYDLGFIHPYPWLSIFDAADTTGKPAFPTAFRTEDFLPDTEADQTLEKNIQNATVGRCILEVSPALTSLLGNASATSFQIALRRILYKYILRACTIRTTPQTRPVHGVLNESLRAQQLNFYSTNELLNPHSTLATRFRAAVLENSGRVIPPETLLFAIELDRSLNTATDSESLRQGGIPVRLLPFNHRYRIESSAGFSIDWQIDTLMSASFPITLTFEAEIEQTA